MGRPSCQLITCGMTILLRSAKADLDQLRHVDRLLEYCGLESEHTATMKDRVDSLPHAGLAKSLPEAVKHGIKRVAKQGSDLVGIPAYPGIFLDDGAEQQVGIALGHCHMKVHRVILHHLP